MFRARGGVITEAFLVPLSQLCVGSYGQHKVAFLFFTVSWSSDLGFLLVVSGIMNTAQIQ